jgi:hypothetical protein
MACTKPLQAWRSPSGEIVFYDKGSGDALELPCGQCIGCRMDRAKAWSIRCMHEASMWDKNCFITLTYNDENLPDNGMLKKEDFQLFMKRLRKRFKGQKSTVDKDGKIIWPIRFYMCGEYGDRDGRPHFHALLFNFDFSDRVLWKKTGAGERLYRSAILEDLWKFGYSSVGDVTVKSAGYVARYVMKKVNGDAARHHYYAGYDQETGECLWAPAEFNRMSLKPGIGQAWFDKFYQDIYPEGKVVLEGGRKVKPPRFYDLKYKAVDPDGFEEVQQARILKALEHRADNTPERLAVKEEVLKARVKNLVRSI